MKNAALIDDVALDSVSGGKCCTKGGSIMELIFKLFGKQYGNSRRHKRKDKHRH